MVGLYRLFDRGDSTGFLPDAGGTLDQAAVNMDAFIAISIAEDELRNLRNAL